MNEKGVKMQEKNVQGKKKQEKKVQGNKSQENRIHQSKPARKPGRAYGTRDNPELRRQTTDRAERTAGI